MKIRLNGKSTATVGNAILKVRGRSGKKYLFKKKPSEGYIFETDNDSDIIDLFESQTAKFAYFFTPILGKEKKEEPIEFSYEELSLEELKELCDKLGIETIPQDKERSLKRMLEAYKLGASS